MAAATMCSRVTGLVREALFAALFAVRGVADAYVFAFRIPNLLREFFAEGALASAFVPEFARVKEQEGEARAFELARRVLGTLGAVAAAIVLLGIVFAPAVVSVVAWDAPAEWRPLTITLTRIMFPFLLLVAWASVAMGVLNTYRRYFLPALAPVFFNVSAVLCGTGLLVAGLEESDAAIVWCAFVVVGGAAQLLVQLPALRAIGFRFRPQLDLRLRDPSLRTIVRRMGPVVLSLAGTNVMVVVTTILASQQRGWASSLNYAFRLVHLPIGVVGVAVGTVVLAAAARRAAATDAAGLDDLVRRGLRLNWFLALPAAVGLFVLAEPIVALVYQRGTFEAGATRLVAEVLSAYAGGIVFYAGVKAAVPQFLTRGDTRTPMLCALLGLAVNLAVALLALDGLGVRALAFAVAAGAATNYLTLRGLARHRYGGRSGPGFSFLLRTCLAATVLGVLAWLARDLWLVGDRAVVDPWARGLLTLGLIGLLGALYLLVAARLGIEEAGWLRRRFGSGRGA
ncbi:MAG: murein biosynthesis integral membrane protein MurJ [Planctomycetota bacterium]|nr:murein biosynthesis integral membrane protein MurJ [Planctomycetota bacterium]